MNDQKPTTAPLAVVVTNQKASDGEIESIQRALEEMDTRLTDLQRRVRHTLAIIKLKRDRDHLIDAMRQILCVPMHRIFRDGENYHEIVEPDPDEAIRIARRALFEIGVHDNLEKLDGR